VFEIAGSTAPISDGAVEVLAIANATDSAFVA
jgi:hypothetical protein